MTTFAEYLVAASSLSSGTVWELITHPRTGGTGTTIYDQTKTTLSDALIFSLLRDDTIDSSVAIIDAATSLPDSTIIVNTK